MRLSRRKICSLITWESKITKQEQYQQTFGVSNPPRMSLLSDCKQNVEDFQTQIGNIYTAGLELGTLSDTPRGEGKLKMKQQILLFSFTSLFMKNWFELLEIWLQPTLPSFWEETSLIYTSSKNLFRYKYILFLLDLHFAVYGYHY